LTMVLIREQKEMVCSEEIHELIDQMV
jgi:hypothetical protein